MSKASMLESLTTKWIGLRMAHEAMMLDDASQILKFDREDARDAKRNLLDLSPPAAEEGDDMIHVGDVHNHTHNMRHSSHRAPLLAGILGAALAAMSGAGLATYLMQPKPTPSTIAAPPSVPVVPPSTSALPAQEWEVPWQIGPDGKVQMGRPKRVE